MLEIFRDSPLGTVLRSLTSNKIAAYPEHLPTFKIPRHLQQNQGTHDHFDSTIDTLAEPTIIGWYNDNDPGNPQNWSTAKKVWVGLVLLMYTFSVYIGSSVYTSSIPGIVRTFEVSSIVASLGLSLYVVGYSLGPMLWTPLSEIPAIGRNPQYILTYVLFAVLCIPTALVSNFTGLLVLRFLLGFTGSPCLATAGASYGDFVGGRELPYVIALWGGGATLGPALGPFVSGFAVMEENWRWSSWELLWLAGPTCVVMFVSLPETSADAILYYRAKRLRQVTGRSDLKARSELRQSKMKTRLVAFDTLVKPWEINILDPAVLFTTVYTAITYAIYYSFFESFPIVYQDMYGFDLGQLGLAFLAVLVGLVAAVVLYMSYLYLIADPRFARMDPHCITPEMRLVPGLFAAFFVPIGLFIFAWTAKPSIHWIVSLVGVATSMFGVFIITQCIFIYLPFTYAHYSGSLFAANGFARGCLAAGAIVFARPFFSKLGVNGGVSLLAGLTVLCVVGMYLMYWFGATLRKKSRFAVSLEM